MGGGSVIWDAEDLLESRVQAVRELPWVIPALTVMQMTDLDLDHLDMAADTDGYWAVLNAIVTRIERNAA
jgi:hypothetical protein